MNNEELQAVLNLVGYNAKKTDSTGGKIIFLENYRKETLEKIHRLEKSIDYIDYVILSLVKYERR
ncbi:MAG: hypothetical protein IJT03_08435 [Clostridia bacterium]|nr:hypothetical protein [Clostridia bacterium]